MSDFKPVTKREPCPVCGKPDWCAWTPDRERLLCQRSAEAPAGWRLVKAKEGGGLFEPDDDLPEATTGTWKPSRRPKAAAPLVTGDAGKKRERGYGTAKDLVAAAYARMGTPAGRWTYRDAAGEPVGLVLRFNEADGGKTYRQASRCPDDGLWRAEAMPKPRPLFRLPELLAAKPAEVVHVLEGEKTAEAAAGLGLLATAAASGSGAPVQETDWGPLAGRRVVVLADHDDPGRKWAARVAEHLGEVAADVRVVHPVERWPDLPGGGDLVDVLEGGTKPEAVRAAVAELVTKSPAPMRPGPVLQPFSTIEPREVRWLWPQRIPLGRLTVLAGPAGLGKSFLTAELAAHVSTGKAWPDGLPCPSGSVLMLCAEDDPHDTTRPRLDGQGADVRRVYAMPAVRARGGSGKVVERVVTLADLPEVEAALDAMQECRLIVVDPIGSYLGGSVDAYRDNEVRGVLAPLAKLAAERDLAVVVVAHVRKASVTAADDAVLGSRAMTALARQVLHLLPDADDTPEEGEARDRRRLLLPGKSNLGRRAAGLAFDVVAAPGGSGAVLRWSDGEVNGDADTHYARQASGGRGEGGGGALEEAKSWLVDVLEAGPVGAREVRKLAADDGQAWATVQRAKDGLGVVATKSGGRGAPWLWSLAAKVRKPPGKGDVGAFKATPENPAGDPEKADSAPKPEPPAGKGAHTVGMSAFEQEPPAAPGVGEAVEL